MSNYYDNKELACNCKNSKIPSYRTNFDKNMIKKNKQFLSTVLTCPHATCTENFADYQHTGDRQNVQNLESAFGRTSFDVAQNIKYCKKAITANTNFSCESFLPSKEMH